MKTLQSFLCIFSLIVAMSAQAEPIDTQNWFALDLYAKKKDSKSSKNHQLIHAQEAHARGYTGKGIIITIVDSGVDVNHLMFKNRLLPGWDTRTISQPNQSDTDGHGTHVAGIAAGGEVAGYEKYRGVAYEATILPVVLNFEGSSDRTTAKMIEYSTRYGSVVSNNSWGYSQDIYDDVTGKLTGYYSVPITDFTRNDFMGAMPHEMNAYMKAAQKGHIFVFAAGNHHKGDAYKEEPGLMAALPERFPELKEHWIAVVNVDMNGKIADSSHYCGSAADWCIAAPGSDINSAQAGGNFIEYTGTSMAAPHVTGGVAVVTGAFPNLSSEKVVNRLFVTANHEGIYADKAIYGHGLMNLGQATLPIGQLMLPTGKKALQTQHAFASQWYQYGQLLRLPQGFTSLKVAAVDDYDGARFLLPLSTLVQSNTKPTSALAENFTEQKFDLQTAKVGDDRRQFSLQYHRESTGEMTNTHWQWQQQMDEIGQVGVSFNTPYQWLSQSKPDAILNTLWQHPYLQLTGKGYQAQYQGESLYAPTVMLSVGQSELDSEQGHVVPQAQNYGVLYQQPLLRTEMLSVQAVMGSLVEPHSVLGTYATEALGSATQTPTYYTGVQGALALNTDWKWLAGFYQGNTKTDQSTAGLIRHLSDIKTDSMHTGLVYGHDETQGGFLVRQPLRVTSGQVMLHLPVEVDKDQTVQYQDYAVNLEANRELEYTWFYKAPLEKNWDFTVVTQYQDQPQAHPELNHNASGMVYFTRNF